RPDGRDRYEPGQHVDDRLTEREWRERKTDERREERDIEREEHRERSDEEAGPRPPVEAVHVWHDKPGVRKCCDEVRDLPCDDRGGPVRLLLRRRSADLARW